MAFGDFTVARAGTKYRLNSSGVLESMANNVLAPDYNTDGTFKGIFPESAATTLVGNSAFSGTLGFNTPTNWTFLVVGGGTREIIASGYVSGANAVRMTAGTGDRRSRVAQTITWDNIEYTLQVTIEAYSGSGNARFFAVDGRGVHDNLDEFTGFDPNGVFPQTITRTFTPTAGSGGLRIGFGTNAADTLATDGDTITISAVDVKAGSFASSPIIHTGSGSASRLDDSVSLTGATDLIGQTEGRLVAVIDTRNLATLIDGQVRRIFCVGDGTANNRILLRKTAEDRLQLFVTEGGVTQVNIVSDIDQSGIFAIVARYKVDDFSFHVNGATIGTDTSGTVPPCSNTYVGVIETGDGTSQFNDHIQFCTLSKSAGTIAEANALSLELYNTFS